MRAAPEEGGFDFGGGGNGGGWPQPTAPVNNALLNWGPLASATDKLFVPGVSDPNQGVFGYSTKPPNPTTLAPTSVPTERKPADNGGGYQPGTMAKYVMSRWLGSKTPFNNFLRGIMTPAQYNQYGNSAGGNAFIQGRQ